MLVHRFFNGLVCLSLCLTTPALAQSGPLVGDISGAEFRPYPIAVPDIRADDKDDDVLRTARLALTKIIRDDLDLSGVFRVLDNKSFIDSDGLSGADVRFADWSNVGADGLVKGKIERQGAGYAVQIYAFQVPRQRLALQRKYDEPNKSIRELGHAIADDLYRQFTGEPGVFQSQIAYVKKIRGEKQIFIMDMDGGDSRQLTKGGGLNLLPSFSPDGKQVLFTSYRYDNPDLFEVPSEGGPIKRLSQRPGLNTGAKVSPDNQTIALTLSKDGNSELYLLERDGNMNKRLTNAWGIDTSPSWSPDGKSIAFVSSRAGNPHIYLMDTEGNQVRRLTFQGKYNQTPAFSPRGDLIAFTARDEFNRFDIFTIHVETGAVTRLTQDQGNNEDPTFSPNGRLIAFTSTRSGTRQIWITNLSGSHQRQITVGGNHSSPAWGPFRK